MNSHKDNFSIKDDFLEQLRASAEKTNFNPHCKSVLCTSDLQPGVFWYPYPDNELFMCNKCNKLATEKAKDSKDNLLFLSCSDCMFKFRVE